MEWDETGNSGAMWPGTGLQPLNVFRLKGLRGSSGPGDTETDRGAA
jgi:hypothetical protein